MAKSFSHPRILPQRGGLRLSDQQRKAATIWYNWFAGGGARAKGSIDLLLFSDSHSFLNDANGGVTDPIAFAFNALPLANQEPLIILHQGDFWNEPNIVAARGAEVKAELDVLGRNRVYACGGNHDWWNTSVTEGIYLKYIDDFGLFPETSGVINASRPITPVGDPLNYYIRKGNMMWIMMSDNQYSASPMGEEEQDYSPKSWNTAGGYSNDQWRWLIKAILSNLDCNIVIHTHHPLKDTVVGSRFQDTFIKVVGGYQDPTGGNVDFENFRGSYMAFIENVASELQFQDFFTAVSGFPVAFFSGHNHVDIDETDSDGNTWYETKYGMPHINAVLVADAVLNTTGGHRSFVTANIKVLKVEGSVLNMKTHVHVATTNRELGFQPDLEKNINLRFPYNEDYISSDPSTPSAPSIISIDVSVKGCATVNVNKGSADGVLVVRKKGAFATFTPSANTEYFRGDAAGDGEVVYMGTVTSYQDYGLFSGEQYYTVFAFNGRNDKIAFSSGVQQSATVVKADVAKIIADMAIPVSGYECECVQFLDSRVGVTVTGVGVSTWADQSGNGRDATQATDANRPTYADSRISFTTAGSKFLTNTANSWHYFGHPTSNFLIDVPFGIFAKVRMTDATGFRIAAKLTAEASEFQVGTTAEDKLFIALYDGTTSNFIQIPTKDALTDNEGHDIFIVANYLGGKKLGIGGATLAVYDKDFNLITSEDPASATSGGTYAKMRDGSISLTIGRHNLGPADYSDGQINGRVIKKGDIIHPHEVKYLMDYFSYTDDV